MRDFNEADKKKKMKRVQPQENLSKLSVAASERLEARVRASLKDSYLPCGVAFKIAAEENVPKIAVGEMTDRLGLRITNCQIGCFKVDKTLFDNPALKTDDEVVARLEKLKANDELTCVNVFELAKELKVTPMAVGNAASLRGWKVRQCQLGCF
jgi:hypothetical protein